MNNDPQINYNIKHFGLDDYPVREIKLTGLTSKKIFGLMSTGGTNLEKIFTDRG